MLTARACAPRPVPPTPRRGRRTRAPAARRRGPADRRRLSSRPTSFSEPEVERPAAGRGGPGRAARASPRSRSRCRGSRAASASCARGRGCAGPPVRTPPRARRARARPRAAPARSKDWSNAGAVAASTAGAGRSRRAAVDCRPVRPQRRPSAATTRRSIAAARSNSISCSQIAQASASNGSGRRSTRSHGRRRTERPDQRVAQEAPAKRAQVVVDAERESHPRDAVARRPPGVGARPEQNPVGRRSAPRPPPPAARRGEAAVRAPPRDGAARRRCPPAAAGERARRARTSSRSSTTWRRLPTTGRRPAHQDPRSRARQQMHVHEQRAGAHDLLRARRPLRPRASRERRGPDFAQRGEESRAPRHAAGGGAPDRRPRPPPRTRPRPPRRPARPGWRRSSIANRLRARAGRRIGTHDRRPVRQHRERVDLLGIPRRPSGACAPPGWPVIDRWGSVGSLTRGSVEGATDLLWTVPTQRAPTAFARTRGSGA